MKTDKTPIIVVDAGGTNIRVAGGFLENNRFTITARKHYKTAQYTTINPVLQEFLSENISWKPEIIALCGAGPVKNNHITMSNADFSLSQHAIEHEFKTNVLLMNDFSAMTWGVLEDFLHGKHEHELIHGEPQRNTNPIVALGPGTGLGFGFAVFNNNGPLVFASEGGHTAIPVWDSTSAALALFTAERNPEGFDVEKLISGSGIALIYEFITKGSLHPDIASIPVKERPARITELAINGNDDARKTIDLFVALLARYCAESTAIFLPQGIFITGGVCQKIKPLFNKNIFSEHFKAGWAPSLQPVLSNTPIYLAGTEDTALFGLAFASAIHYTSQ
ncbi:MAG TPA: ROK family protein [Spirochaetia bacterium]|nr:ROK family protein [Spirochaetia bacterium]